MNMLLYCRPVLRYLIGVVGLASLLILPGGPLALAGDRNDPDPARFEKDIASFEAWDRKNAPPKEPILFVGSSSIRMWETRVSFPDLPVINRGFGGAHISDVLHFAQRVVIPYNAPIIVFYCGDNDIAGGKSPERVAMDFEKFVKLVRQNRPDTRIIYLPIKPSNSRWKFWPAMRTANEFVLRICAADDQLFCVDTATPLLGDDGRPQNRFFLKDCLHLNADGYRVWTEVVAPVLKRVMKN